MDDIRVLVLHDTTELGAEVVQITSLVCFSTSCSNTNITVVCHRVNAAKEISTLTEIN